MADWSEVKWLIYESPTKFRVLAPKLSRDGKREVPRSSSEMRPGEALTATVMGVSLATVLAILKAGVPAGLVQAKVGEFAEAQYKRSADDRRPNLYLELVAKTEREKRELHDKREAA